MNQVFERSWAEFENRMTEIIKIRPTQTKESRTDRDILEEMLELVRRIDKNQITQNNPDFLTPEFKKSLEGKINRLVNDFGVERSEAIRSIINELDKEIGLPIQKRIIIQNYLRQF